MTGPDLGTLRRFVTGRRIANALAGLDRSVRECDPFLLPRLVDSLYSSTVAHALQRTLTPTSVADSPKDTHQKACKLPKIR